MDIKVTDVRCQKGDAAFLIDDGKTSILYESISLPIKLQYQLNNVGAKNNKTPKTTLKNIKIPNRIFVDLLKLFIKSTPCHS